MPCDEKLFIQLGGFYPCVFRRVIQSNRDPFSITCEKNPNVIVNMKSFYINNYGYKC